MKKFVEKNVPLKKLIFMIQAKVKVNIQKYQVKIVKNLEIVLLNALHSIHLKVKMENFVMMFAQKNILLQTTRGKNVLQIAKAFLNIILMKINNVLTNVKFKKIIKLIIIIIMKIIYVYFHVKQMKNFQNFFL